MTYVFSAPRRAADAQATLTHRGEGYQILAWNRRMEIQVCAWKGERPKDKAAAPLHDWAYPKALGLSGAIELFCKEAFR